VGTRSAYPVAGGGVRIDEVQYSTMRRALQDMRGCFFVPQSAPRV